MAPRDSGRIRYSRKSVWLFSAAAGPRKSLRRLSRVTSSAHPAAAPLTGTPADWHSALLAIHGAGLGRDMEVFR